MKKYIIAFTTEDGGEIEYSKDKANAISDAIATWDKMCEQDKKHYLKNGLMIGAYESEACWDEFDEEWVFDFDFYDALWEARNEYIVVEKTRDEEYVSVGDLDSAIKELEAWCEEDCENGMKHKTEKVNFIRDEKGVVKHRWTYEELPLDEYYIKDKFGNIFNSDGELM